MLQPATWRGVAFAVTDSSTSGGRRIAMHRYPGRDTVWAEDMGRAERRFRLRGFVLNGDALLGGGTIAAQRVALINACEQDGSGTLQHPTLGPLTVNLENWSVGEDLGAGTTSIVELAFVEAGTQTFPLVAPTTSGAAAAATKLKTASATNGVSALAAAAAGLRSIRAAISGAVATVTGAIGTVEILAAVAHSWVSYIEILAVDATALYHLVAVLPGSYGRYTAGGNAGLNGTNATAYSASTTVADLIADASQQRVAVTTAAAALIAAIEVADLSNPVTIPPAVEALIDALAAACADPADALRLMTAIIVYTLSGLETDIGSALSTMIVREAAAALTTAVTAYQPLSANDAAARISLIAPVLDTLALAAADAGEDDSFDALEACRGAIVADLRARGATLAQVKTFAFAQSMPALALAQEIYGDASRADQLVVQVDPPHPLFFPTSFQALAA